MKAGLLALFRALPLIWKLYWVVLSVLPVLASLAGMLYSVCWQLAPVSLRMSAAPPGPQSFLAGVEYGLFQTAVVGIRAAFRLRAQRARERLVQTGHRLDLPAKVEESAWRSGNVTQYYLLSHWQHPTTRQKYSFESERLDFDPSAYVQQASTFPVYLFLSNPTTYYFDVSRIPSPRRWFQKAT